MGKNFKFYFLWIWYDTNSLKNTTSPQAVNFKFKQKLNFSKTFIGYADGKKHNRNL